MLVTGINPAQNPTSPASHTVHLYDWGTEEASFLKRLKNLFAFLMEMCTLDVGRLRCGSAASLWSWVICCLPTLPLCQLPNCTVASFKRAKYLENGQI